MTSVYSLHLPLPLCLSLFGTRSRWKSINEGIAIWYTDYKDWINVSQTKVKYRRNAGMGGLLLHLVIAFLFAIALLALSNIDGLNCDIVIRTHI